ncbi:hypothetical protein NEF87_001598 [Candidatus Lokiarchaeum ossiferum]|uniref:ABC transporter permease n=1 Tax=Candidatus Lokiarchaeum ossiferum TaxID=2951803 RepID=A0ABY6HP63_9ARCH|nr:hypothetical protein NEF87_001598 [Candidatus Lokiarchaeum sp. B-35]
MNLHNSNITATLGTTTKTNSLSIYLPKGVIRFINHLKNTWKVYLITSITALIFFILFQLEIAMQPEGWRAYQFP